MKKCCFVIPYFGSLPNYIELFFKTCEYNKDFNWLFITDQEIDFKLPCNVIMIKLSFDDLKKRISDKFDFKISLETPYKLCDYKPAYGYIFSDFLKEYRYWGHCDVDILLGNLSKFLTDDFMDKYDKIFCLGHMIIYKNTDDNNKLFMKKMDNEFWYKESFESKKITIFDETYNNKKNINTIFLNNKKRVFQEDWSLNIKILPTRFTRTMYNYKKNKYDTEKYKESVYLWEKGNLFRLYSKNHKIVKEDFLYIHLQERKMKYNEKILKYESIQITPNKFYPNNTTFNNLFDIIFRKKRTISFHYLQFHYKWQKRKIKRILIERKKKNG